MVHRSAAARSPPGGENVPALKGRIQDRNRGDQDVPLVRGRIKAVAEGEINQRREGQHGREGDRVERSHSHSRFAGGKVPASGD